MGRDIGKERAAMEWVRAYAHIWLKIHKPDDYALLIKKIGVEVDKPQKKEMALQPCS